MTSHFPIFWDIETTGLNPLARSFWNNSMEAQVHSVGYGYIENWDEDPSLEEANIKVMMEKDASEYKLLSRLSDKFEAIPYEGEPFLVGYNSRNYDHPYIGARFARLRLDGEPFVSEWKRLDMMRVAGKDPIIDRRYPKEDEYTAALGIENDDPYDGSDMPDAFQNREWGKIRTHVISDVRTSIQAFIKRRDMMMREFYDHYGIDADGSAPPEIQLE